MSLDNHPLAKNSIALVLVLREPMEPKARDVTIVEREGGGFRTRSYNLPSTYLLENRIGYLARRALVDMTRYALSIKMGADEDFAPPEEALSNARTRFAQQNTRLEVLVGKVRGGTNADIDNTLKIVADSLVPVVFPNDRHIGRAKIARITHYSGDDPMAKAGQYPTIIIIESPAGDGATDSGLLVFPSHNAKWLTINRPIINAST